MLHVRVPHIPLLSSGCIPPSCSSQQPGKITTATPGSLKSSNFLLPKAKVNLFIPHLVLKDAHGQVQGERTERKTKQTKRITLSCFHSHLLSHGIIFPGEASPGTGKLQKLHLLAQNVHPLLGKQQHTQSKRAGEEISAASSLYIDSESTERETQSTWEVFKNRSCRKPPRMIDL